MSGSMLCGCMFVFGTLHVCRVTFMCNFTLHFSTFANFLVLCDVSHCLSVKGCLNKFQTDIYVLILDLLEDKL